MPKARPLLLVAGVLAAAALPTRPAQSLAVPGRGFTLSLSIGALVRLQIGLGA